MYCYPFCTLSLFAWQRAFLFIFKTESVNAQPYLFGAPRKNIYKCPIMKFLTRPSQILYLYYMRLLCRNIALATDYLVFNSGHVVLLVENLMGNSIHWRPREDIYNALLMAPVTGGNSMNQKEISSSIQVHEGHSRSSAARIKCLSR